MITIRNNHHMMNNKQYYEYPSQQSYVSFNYQQQQYVPNGPSYMEVVILMDGVKETLEAMDERLQV